MTMHHRLPSAQKLSRRGFLHAGAAAGGGLILGISLPFASDETSAAVAESFTPNAFVHIGGDETAELGSGQTRELVEQHGVGEVYLEHLQRVSLCFDTVENMLNPTVGTDDESRARDSFHNLAVHIFVLYDTECRADLLVCIRQQGVRQVVLVLKFLLLF